MTATDTPRTDACPHCGAEERPYSIAIREYNCETLIGKIDGAIQRSELCREREARHKTEAEVERLRANLNRTIKIALMIWGDKPSDKDWPELRAELDELKATLNHTEK
jgi:hypothetical protein